MYIELDQIEGLHLELTSKCNLACLQCSRIYKKFPLRELSLVDLENLFKGFIKPLDIVHICGNYGDSIVYSDLHKAIDIFKKHKTKYIRIYTNGSARSSDWWIKLGEQLKNCGEIIFSIDGLEDTNHIYRKYSSWPIIMNSVKSFIDAGGKAIWEMLAFEHNEHQLYDAKELSKKLNFFDFRVKKANRFGTLGYKNDVVFPPKQDLFKHDSIIARDENIDKIGYDSFMNNQKIHCQYKKRQWIYIDFNGTVLPCCWFGTPWWDGELDQFKIYDKELNIKHNKLSNILKNPFYKSELENSWENNNKAITCSIQCGNFDVSTKQNTITI
mgnify:CR=1 FL=1